MDLRYLGVPPARWRNGPARGSRFRRFPSKEHRRWFGHSVCFPHVVGSDLVSEKAYVHNRFYLIAATCLFAFAITVRTTGGAAPYALQAQAPAPLQRRRPRSRIRRQATPGATPARSVTPRGHRSRARRMAGEEPTIASGDARMRELPRSRPGARRRREQGEHPEVRADEARARSTRRACRATTAAITRDGKAARTSAAICRAPRATACTARSRPTHQLVKRTQTELCATCHRVQVAKTDAPSRTCPCAKARWRAGRATTRTGRSAT